MHCAAPWVERVSVSQMLLGGDVIAVHQEPLVLVQKVAEVRKLEVLGFLCRTFEDNINSMHRAGVYVSLCLVCMLAFFCPL